MAIDRKKWNESLKHVGTWQGSRCADIALKGKLTKEECMPGLQPEQRAQIIAAAILATALSDLAVLASSKLLTPADLEVVRLAAIEAAGLVEVQEPTGGVVLRLRPLSEVA